MLKTLKSLSISNLSTSSKILRIATYWIFHARVPPSLPFGLSETAFSSSQICFYSCFFCLHREQGSIPLIFHANILRVTFKFFLYLFIANQCCKFYFLNISQIINVPFSRHLCHHHPQLSKDLFLTCLLYFSSFSTRFLAFPVFLSQIIQYVLKSCFYNISMTFNLPFNPRCLSISCLITPFLTAPPLLCRDVSCLRLAGIKCFLTHHLPISEPPRKSHITSSCCFFFFLSASCFLKFRSGVTISKTLCLIYPFYPSLV